METIIRLFETDGWKKYTFAVMVLIAATWLQNKTKLSADVWGWTIVGMGSLLAGTDIGKAVINNIRPPTPTPPNVTVAPYDGSLPS